MQPESFSAYRPYDPIIVTWMDIHVDGASLDPEDYIENYEPCIRRTAGFFLALKHDHLFICETDDRQAHTEELVERINSFPLSIIQSLQ